MTRDGVATIAAAAATAAAAAAVVVASEVIKKREERSILKCAIYQYPSVSSKRVVFATSYKLYTKKKKGNFFFPSYSVPLLKEIRKFCTRIFGSSKKITKA